MKERIRAIIEYAGITQVAFAKKLELQQSTISMWLSGKNTPTDATKQLICKTFGISRTWLETGEGDMMDKSVEQDIELLTRVMECGSSAKKQLIRIVAAMPDDLLESMVNYLKGADNEEHEVELHEHQ